MNWAYTKEHDAVAALPPLSPRRPFRSLRLLLGDHGWLLGFATETAGWLVYVAALRLAPLSLVQAVSASGIAVLALFSVRGHLGALTVRERLAVGIALLGLVFLALSLVGAKPTSHTPHVAAVLLWLAASAGGAVALIVVRIRLTRAAALGLATGLLFADGDISATHVSSTADCTTDITHEPGIDVTKSCPESVPFGEDIEYTITVTNTGNEALEGVTVDDTLLGDITGEFDFDFSNPFPVGEVATAVVSYTPQAGDPDPITNTVTASGTGADSGVEASDEASCETDILHPTIDVEKQCTELAHVGDTVTYTITVTNTGDEDLDGVTVMDTVLGDLSAAFADELAVGASESHEFDYVVLDSDPDPLVNEVTATGTGVSSQVVVDDLANCATDLIHPAIEIVKTVDEDTVPIGTTVTFTYVVTNTGDTTLYDISVDDDILGHIGDIEVLEPGQSVTLTKDFVVGDAPVTNVGTATGEDILGRSVSADDDATVTPIADVTPPPTPFTGSDAGRLGLITMVLFGIGVTVIAVTRKRRPEREAA